MNFVRTVDNVLDIDEQEFIDTLNYNASSRILQSLEKQITNLQKMGRNFTQIGRNVGVRSIQLPANSISLTTGITFVSKIPVGFANKPELSEDDTLIIYDGDTGVDINQIEASIELPSEVFTFGKI